jgi:hypothetical protein
MLLFPLATRPLVVFLRVSKSVVRRCIGRGLQRVPLLAPLILLQTIRGDAANLELREFCCEEVNLKLKWIFILIHWLIGRGRRHDSTISRRIEPHKRIALDRHRRAEFERR